VLKLLECRHPLFKTLALASWAALVSRIGRIGWIG